MKFFSPTPDSLVGGFIGRAGAGYSTPDSRPILESIAGSVIEPGVQLLGIAVDGEEMDEESGEPRTV